MSRSMRKHCRAAVPTLLTQALVRCSAGEQMHALLHLPGEARSNFFPYKAKLVGCAWQSLSVKQIQDVHLALQPTPICRLYAWPVHKHRPGVCPPHPALRTAEAARLSAQLPWHTSCRRTAFCLPLTCQRELGALRDDGEESGPVSCVLCVAGDDPRLLKVHCPVHILATRKAPCNSLISRDATGTFAHARLPADM